MSIWQQSASIFAVSEGLFDKVPASNVKEAQKALLTRLTADHKKEMGELNKGAEKLTADDAMGKIVAKVAKTVAKGFEG